jgi:hypothetical protein
MPLSRPDADVDVDVAVVVVVIVAEDDVVGEDKNVEGN